MDPKWGLIKRLVVLKTILFSIGCVSASTPSHLDLSQFPIKKTLPEALQMADGQKVMSLPQWQDRRRPELKKMFLDLVYGHPPENLPITFQTVKGPLPIPGTKGIYKEVIVRFPTLAKPGVPADQNPQMRLAMFLPNTASAQKPVRVFLALNKCGNQEVSALPEITVNPKAWTAPPCRLEGWIERGGRPSFWAMEEIVKRGYGLVTVHESDIVPDDPAQRVEKLKVFTTSQPQALQWGNISIWAWGLSRVVDYLRQDPMIDKNKIALVGHSRRGKAALLATALDERIAMVVPHQSGTLGMALSRDNDQETVKKINDQFPHWFSENFKSFNGNEYQLPVDQHLLVGLVAPRPLLDTEGVKDLWSNYKSGVLTIKAANEIYSLYGKKGVVGDGVFEKGEKLNANNVGRIVQYRLDTGHDLNADYWRVIMDFADIQFKKQQL